MRPRSIVQFERYYLGALVVGLVGTAMGWSVSMRRLAETAATASVASWYLPVTTAASAALMLLLWYFVARRASPVAKWIVTILTVIAAVSSLVAFYVLLSGASPSPPASALGIAAVVLEVIAVAMLFRADARAWFEGKTA